MEYSDLESQLIKAIEGQGSSNQSFSQDQLKSLTNSVDEHLKKMFPDKFNQSGEFDQTLIQGMKTSDVLIMALGASVSGAVGGIIGGLAGGLGVSIAGINAVIVGFLARKFFAKSGSLARFFDGVIIGGKSAALAGLGLSQQVSGVFGGLGGAGSTIGTTGVSASAQTPQTAALRGTTSGMAVPAGFTE